MKHLRTWSAEYATQVWQSLESKPGAKTDMGGWNGAKRVQIASNIVGEDVETNSKGQFEQKGIQHSSKIQKGMSEDHKDSLWGEMHTGFARLGTNKCDELSFHANLGAQSMTSTSASSASGLKDILANVAQMVSPAKTHAEGLESSPAKVEAKELQTATVAKCVHTLDDICQASMSVEIRNHIV
jgi:hypothetical protein